ESFADISHEMHFHTPTLVVYILGTLGVAYHLANGLQTAAMGWGLVSTRRALKTLDRFAIGFFLLLLAMAWGAIYALWVAGGAPAVWVGGRAGARLPLPPPGTFLGFFPGAPPPPPGGASFFLAPPPPPPPPPPAGPPARSCALTVWHRAASAAAYVEVVG